MAPAKHDSLEVPANDTSVNSGAKSDTYVSCAYAANPPGSSRTTSGSTSAEHVALRDVQTVCCAP
jgi:hypothetical protein